MLFDHDVIVSRFYLPGPSIANVAELTSNRGKAHDLPVQNYDAVDDLQKKF